MAFVNKVVSAKEQETVIQFDRYAENATVYTSDSTVINKLMSKGYTPNKEYRNSFTDGVEATSKKKKPKIAAMEFLIKVKDIWFAKKQS